LALLAAVGKGSCGMGRISRGFAELPEFCGRPLVAVNEVVELELIDLAGVELGKARANVLEEDPELFLVIGRDRFAS
jgi:hypothetical protein